jgi:hypothetical protein
MQKPKGKPRGGSRKGKPNKSKIRTKLAVERIQAAVAAADPEAVELFKGDAHAFLISVYQDPRSGLPARLDAAKAAAKYEKPALAATEMRLSDKDGKPLQLAPVINLTLTTEGK